MSGEWFVIEIGQRYGDFSFIYNSPADDTDYGYFKRVFTNFVDANVYNWYRYALATVEQYGVLNEFERTEEEAYKNTREVENGKTLTTEYGGEHPYSVETTHKRATTNQVTTFDNSSFRNLSHTYDAPESGETSSDSTEYGGSILNTAGGTDTITDTRLKADNNKEISGRNTSPQELLMKELELRRMKEIDDIILEEFAKRYLFLEV